MPTVSPGSAGAVLTGAGLAEALCGPDDIAGRLVRALFGALGRAPLLDWEPAFVAWQELFRLGDTDATQRRVLDARQAALEGVVGAPLATVDVQYRAIFAVTTAFALVAKSVADDVTAGLGDARAHGGWACLGDAELGELFHGLETGAGFRARGVDGLGGDDPFGWYLGAWGGDLPAAVRSVRAAIADRAPGPPEDLLRALYARMMPAAVRHGLGEFYTPPWLADVVVAGALAEAGVAGIDGGALAAAGAAEVAAAGAESARHAERVGWRGLDPCCGSGAFLMVMVRRVLAETAGLPAGARVRAVLGRVHGIDLNPIAVLAARVNILAAIAPLLAPGDRVRLPVARGDATRGDAGSNTPIGRFDLVVGNPPWVDWKRLPASYRARLKASGVARHLFSGDRMVGGISLNVCALVAHTAAEAWLAPGGVMGLLMPASLLVQQSYAGFRTFQLSRGRLHVRALDDWSRAGHPFAPVTERFLTWYVGDAPPPGEGVPVRHYVRRSGRAGDALVTATTAAEAHAALIVEVGLAGGAGSGGALAWASDPAELQAFTRVRGPCAYLGREGVELYPQELWLFTVAGPGAEPGTVRVRNYQGGRSRYRVPAWEGDLEAAFLHPVLKGVDLGRFAVAAPRFVAPFPYDPRDMRLPLPMEILRVRAPRLAAWLDSHRDVLAAQPAYNTRIIGQHRVIEPHALARVGRYTFAPCHVVFRDNTRWGAAVVTTIDTPWGGPRAPRFQNHAVSMCERADGGVVSRDEAHYLCGALNAPIVGRLLAQSSDSRSFKIRPPVRVPAYEAGNPLHRALGALSERAHVCVDDPAAMAVIDAELDRVYRGVIG
jgi:hypothetical protein